MFAYEFDQTGAVDPSTSMNPASVNQDLIVTVGQAYTLTFRTYFDTCTTSEGFVGVMLNHAAVYTVDACDFGAGAYKSNTVNFTATASPWNLRFEFEVGEPTAVVKIDNGMYIFGAKPSRRASLYESRHTFREQKAPDFPSGCPILELFNRRKGR